MCFWVKPMNRLLETQVGECAKEEEEANADKNDSPAKYKKQISQTNGQVTRHLIHDLPAF